MIQLEKFYDIAPSEILYIHRGDGKSSQFPFALEVYFKNGKGIYISYKTEEARDRARVDIINSIARHEQAMRPVGLTAEAAAHEVAKIKAGIGYRIKRELAGVMQELSKIEKMIMEMKGENEK